MLRARLFAPAAPDAVGSLAAPLRVRCVPPAAVPIDIPLVRVEIGKEVGDGDLFRAAVHAVAARRARNGVERAEHLANAVDRPHLRLRERPDVLHKGEIVVHLRHIAHAGEHHADLREVRRKAERIARIGAAVQRVEDRLCAVGQIDENAPFDRLHDDDGRAVPHTHVVAGAALNGIVVVIGVVELKLNDFHRGIRGEDLVEHIGGIVEGKPDVADLPLFFQLERRFIGTAALELLKILRVLRVHQIKIEILYPAPCELLFKERTDIRLRLKIRVGELIDEEKALARVAGDETLTDRKLALARYVPVRRIEIIEPLRQKGVYHV